MSFKTIYCCLFLNCCIFFLSILCIETFDALSCPPKCICSESHIKNHEDRLKAKCGGGGEFFITDIDELHLKEFGNLTNLITLDLSSNNISILPSKMFWMQDLQKLYLNKNQIERIDDGAFLNLSSLKRLDLSNNKIRFITRPIFEGLIHLEKLKLSQNYIRHISEGTFDSLFSIKQLDLSMNPLTCDCELWWLTVWLGNSSVKLTPESKCWEPARLKEQPIRKFKGSPHCAWVDVSALLEITPQHDQVVFEGDSLTLDCRSGFGNAEETKIIWYWAGLPPEQVFPNSVHLKNQHIVLNTDTTLIESSLTIDKLEANHTGEWICELYSAEGNHSIALGVTVISNATRYCPQSDTKDNKGRYSWPKTVAGHVVELPCEAEQSPGVASYNCTVRGQWTNLNTSLCPFVSETTRILQQYAKMDLTASHSTIFERAKSLHGYTLSNKKNLNDSMDVVFIARTISNYLNFLDDDKLLGGLLLDLIGCVLELEPGLLAAAQLEDGACSRLLNASQAILPLAPYLSQSSRKWNMAVERIPISRESFLGVSCWLWKSREKGVIEPPICQGGILPPPRHRDKMLVASLQIPASLFAQLESQGKPAVSSPTELIVAMFDSVSLFPLPFNSSRVISSLVVGAKLVDCEVEELSGEPVVVTLTGLREGSSPVWWSGGETGAASAAAAAGGGVWTGRPCRPATMIQDLTEDLLVFHCSSLGYYALSSPAAGLSSPSLRGVQCKSRYASPGIFIGTFIGGTCLLVAAFTYAVCSSSILMPGKMKHALANTWLTVAILAITFCLGIFQTENFKVCQIIGLMLHYFTLCSLFWMAVSINCMHSVGGGIKREVSSEEIVQPVPNPLVGLYLVGWGVPSLLVGLSGAVNPTGYASPAYCSLGPGPGFTPVIVPVGAIAVFIFTRALMVRSAAVEKDSNAQLSEGTQATDLELLETIPTPADRNSLHSITTPSSHIEDLEHPPYVQLKAFLIVVSFFSLAWFSGTLSVIKPFNVPYEETLLSVFYAVFLITLGIFVIFFYCFSRSDVRAVWFTLKHIKRSRNVTDVQTNNRPVSNTARNSITTDVGRKSISPRPEPQGGEATQKPNFVDLYRRQYQNSVISEPNNFYNPHQSIVARKFFKKQRRKQRSLGTRRSGDGGNPGPPDSELFLLGSRPNGHTEATSPKTTVPERPLERLVIGAERYATVASDCCSCLVSEAHSATDCTRDFTSEHSSRSSHLYATVAPPLSPRHLCVDYRNETVRLKMQEPTYVDIKSSDEDKVETCV